MKTRVESRVLAGALGLLAVLCGGVAEAATAIATWDPNSESDLAGYRLYWGPASRGSATNVTQFSYPNQQQTGVSTNPTATVSGLLASTTYYFAVTAFDTSNNESLYSLEVPFTVPALPAAPGNLSATAAGPIRITLVWDDNSNNETGFKIDRRQSGTTPWVRIAAPGANATAHADTGLSPATHYYYQVKAYNAAGDSAYSAPAWATTSAGLPSKALRIAAGTDDVEQRADGTIYTDSTDLELTEDGSGPQAVGLRFTNVDVPRGAVIQNAYVQFQVDEPTPATTSLQIRGQAAGHARPFTTNDNDVTSRATTGASVAWTVPAWNTAGEVGAAQRTPDLSAVIQAIVGHEKWASGNALVLIVTGTGKRTAEAYEGDPAGAPALVIEYETGITDDSDGDGMDDAWEAAQFGGTNAANSAAGEDFDGDGYSNWAEFVAGTDPKAGGTSYFGCELNMAGAQLVVSFPTIVASGPGYTGYTRYYALEKADSPLNSVWAGVSGYTRISAGGTVVFTNTFPQACIFRAKAWLE
ncbi:MAG: fibronectin type III domain-containing protein [Kiritimatiellae bacterium]|nr:fibronectin type III domain-containing protein [Kiritimatiellia bacterium]